MMMVKSVFWWRKPEYPEETTTMSVSYKCFCVGRRVRKVALYVGLGGGSTGYRWWSRWFPLQALVSGTNR